MNVTRRSMLRRLGAGLTIASAATRGVGIVGAKTPRNGGIRRMGHSLLSDPEGGYAEESIRADGQFAVLGSFLGPGGSFLVDIGNPTNPTEVHHVPSPSDGTRHADVKFDHRDGLYYRSLEGENVGTEVIDYGFGSATPEDPEILTRIDAGTTHNVFAHPDEALLYTVNEHVGTSAFDIWDVTDPASPSLVREVGPTGGLHDIVVEPDRNLAHAAFISDAFDGFDPARDFAGYLIYDVRDPRNPVELGRVDYTALPDYTEDRLENGEPGFERCHYANYDSERGLAVVGDELAIGVPGGKHVFDVGWDTGSPGDPNHVGFTYSPNAELMDESGEAFDWTGHNFDVIRKEDTTLLVSGDYHEGTVVYDLTDPTDPTPGEQYRTDDRADEANEPIFDLGEAPMAWGADYSDERDLTVTSDMFTGIYVFKVTPEAATPRGKGR